MAFDSDFQKNVSHAVLKKNMDIVHPRAYDPVTLKPSPISICEETGRLGKTQNSFPNAFEYNNKQVAMYFKLLKGLFVYYCFLAALCLMLMLFYLKGEFSVNNIQPFNLQEITIGNFASTKKMCRQMDLTVVNKLKL